MKDQVLLERDLARLFNRVFRIEFEAIYSDDLYSSRSPETAFSRGPFLCVQFRIEPSARSTWITVPAVMDGSHLNREHLFESIKQLVEVQIRQFYEDVDYREKLNSNKSFAIEQITTNSEAFAKIVKPSDEMRRLYAMKWKI